MNNYPTRKYGFCLKDAMIYTLACCILFFVSCSQSSLPIKGDPPLNPNAVVFKGTGSQGADDPLMLSGTLNKPSGDGPFPAIVLLHGCGGIQPKRDHRWAERLSGWGYVTLQVDSFRPRGISNVCTYSGNDSVDMVEKRVNDAYDAKRYLAGLPFVDRERIAVMGWSHGGMTTLQALYKERAVPFRAAIAFYPSCRRILRGLNAPLLILIGEADDWTPADRCVSMMPKEEGSSVALKVYPGAFHGFDTVGANSRVRGARGMHRIQYNPEAEADSIFQVKGFFEKHLK
jgi:dienelactone hydrolase